MNRRTLLSGLLASTVAYPVWAQGKPLSLNVISTYLNSLKDAKGSFTQINPNGTLSKGTFYLKRPGRMRFEYEGKNNALVVAGQGKLAIFDAKSNTGPQQYPLNKTPLNIILRDVVNLNESGMVKAHQHDGTSTSVTAQDPERPGLGSVKMVFTDAPTELRQWIVTDETGRQTTVVLGDLETKKTIPSRLFDIDALVKKSGPKR